MDMLKIEGIVIEVKKYKDFDCLATLLTKSGIVRIKFVGVRRPKAKFSFAAQPFCHAEFVLSSKKDYAVVTAVDQKNNFFALAQNYDGYCVACEISEIIKKIATENQDNSENFDLFLLSLISLVSGAKPLLVYAFFLAKILKILGVSNFKNCTNCQKTLSDGALLDLDSGALVCKICSGSKVKVISKNILDYMLKLTTESFSELVLRDISDGILQKICVFLKYILSLQI